MDVSEGEKKFIKATEIAMREYALFQFTMLLLLGQHVMVLLMSRVLLIVLFYTSFANNIILSLAVTILLQANYKGKTNI